jgi:hypothetical protein
MRVTKNLLIMLLLLLLVAGRCNDDPPDFTFTLEPAVLELKLDEAASMTIRLNRSRSFRAPVTVTLEGETSGLTVTPLTIEATQTQGTLTILAQDDATLGTSFPVVRVQGGGVDKSETLTLRVAVPTVEILGVAIDGNGTSRQVRQGVGQVSLTVTGRYLKRVTTVSLGDLETQFSVGSDAQSLRVTTTIPHGATLLGHPLIISTPGGDTTVADVLFVTPVTAGATGSDAAGQGTPDQPYRSLRQALSVWEVGSTIYLLNGRYSTASGELWSEYSGLPPDSLPPSTLPAGVIISGESMDGVTLEGNQGISAGLVLGGNAQIANLTLKNFGRALVAGSGAISVENLTLMDNTEGMLLYGTTQVNASQVVLSNSSVAGLSAYGEADISLDRVTAEVNATGLHLYESASLNLSNSHVRANNDLGIKSEGASQLFIQSTEIFDNQPFGVVFGGDVLVMRDSKIYQNTDGGAGLYVEGTPQAVDLGTLSEAGNNQLYDNTGVQLLDARADQAELNTVFITLRATRLNGALPEAGTYLAEETAYFNDPFFTILGRNNGIRVYD